MQTIQRDVQDFVDQRSLDEYFPNSYTVITLSLAAWGLAQIFVPWEMLDLLVGCLTLTLYCSCTFNS